jgi:hypothetical protein
MKEMFPKAKYNENCKKDKNYVAAYLLIHKSNEAVEKYLSGKKDGLIKKKISAVFKNQNFEIDILKIAIIMENHEFLEKYCEKYPHLIGRKDSAGYTPYHIAACVNEKAIEILRKYDKSDAFKLKNKLEGTYKDILNMRKFENPKNQFFYYEENGKIKKGDGNKYKEMIGAVLRKNPYVPEEVAIEIWKEALCMKEEKIKSVFIKDDENFMENIEKFLSQASDKKTVMMTRKEMEKKFLSPNKEGINPEEIKKSQSKAREQEAAKEAYRKYLKEGPKVYVKKTEKVGNELIAKRDIETWETITEFSGAIPKKKEVEKRVDDSIAQLIEDFQEFERLKEKYGNSLLSKMKFFKKTFEDTKASRREEIFKKFGYIIDEIPLNAENYRGMASNVNDGLPNAIMHVIENAAGLPKRSVLVAIDDIKKDEKILCNYGIEHALKKFLPHKEIKLKELRDFVLRIKRENSQKKYFLASELKNSIGNSAKRKISNFHKIIYIISTPHSVLNILNYVKIEDILQCVDILIERVTHLQLEKGDGPLRGNLKRFKKFYSSLKRLKEKGLFEDFLKKAPPSTSVFWNLRIDALELIGEGGRVEIC